MASKGKAPEAFLVVVLALRNAGEGHRVVHAFDQKHGRMAVWARHARGSRKRLAGVLEPFHTLRLFAVPQGELYNLHAAEVTCARTGIRESLAAIGRAANLCNLVRALWPEHQAAPAVFAGLEVALDHVAAGRVARAAGLYPRLAHQAGLMPELGACNRCGAALDEVVLSRVEPLVACRRCRPGEPIASAAVWSGLCGARIADDATADTVEGVVMGWLAAHAGRPLPPWRA